MTDSLNPQGAHSGENRTMEPPPESYPYTPRWVIILFILAFAFSGYLVYASRVQQAATQTALDAATKRSAFLSAEIDKTNSNLADLKAELQMTAQKLGLTEDELAHARSVAQQIRREQKLSDAQLHQQIGEVQQKTSSQIGQVANDLNGTKGDVAATRKDLADTQNKLGTAMGDLGVQSGLIASNHEEVEELKRMGERNIFEFKLAKSNSPQHVGPIELELRKVNTKHYTYTLDVIADDRKIEKKDKTIEEPVQFYVRGARSPYEIVVYDMSKNRITGYLSTPKEVAPASPANK